MLTNIKQFKINTVRKTTNGGVNWLTITPPWNLDYFDVSFLNLNTGIVNGNAKLECKFVFEGKFDTDDEVVLQVTFLEPSDPPTCFNYKNLSIILLKNEGKTIIRYHKNTGKINQYLNIY